MCELTLLIGALKPAVEIVRADDSGSSEGPYEVASRQNDDRMLILSHLVVRLSCNVRRRNQEA